MVLRAVLMKTGLRSLNTARPVNTAHPKTTVYSARPMSHISKSAQSTTSRNLMDDMLPLEEEPNEGKLLVKELLKLLVRIKIDDGNAFWNKIGVNAGDSVNAARNTLTTANFWATAKAKTVNGEVQIQALVDG
ncbi:hypothetical protein Tco_1543557, partial [Tanacetum coccineum]